MTPTRCDECGAQYRDVTDSCQARVVIAGEPLAAVVAKSARSRMPSRTPRTHSPLDRSPSTSPISGISAPQRMPMSLCARPALPSARPARAWDDDACH